MPVYRQPKGHTFTPDKPVEKHFHDHDETWIIMSGKVKAFMIDRDGTTDEFELAAGDVWMIEAGVEHGCEILSDAAVIFPFPGTLAEGCHPPGHYYMEKEGYMPILKLMKERLGQDLDETIDPGQ